MPADPRKPHDLPAPSDRDIAEGDPEVIERELRRMREENRPEGRSGRTRSGQQHDPGAGGGMAPGDEAPPGTPGTGEDICPRCHGTGQIDEDECPNCEGTGTIIEGIGGG